MAQTTELLFGRDIQGMNAFAPFPSKIIYTATLAQLVAATITLPTNYPAWVIAFSYQPGTRVWVDFTGATAAVPVGGTFALSTSELLPGARELYTYAPNGTTVNTLSLITPNTSADVSVTFYAIPKGAIA